MGRKSTIDSELGNIIKSMVINKQKYKDIATATGLTRNAVAVYTWKKLKIKNECKIKYTPEMKKNVYRDIQHHRMKMLNCSPDFKVCIYRLNFIRLRLNLFSFFCR